ncbi:MAG: sigma-54-dependent Fis family transcriptional regulator [Nitrospirae bacterium]|nr:sigma-54-dependent Fis family transcriptional regulator [Nitrospirota bacterium]MBF0535152.1 sigma-54-dependent Fis family transcriptional regulator [Nitrospirota bacterium]MBF0615229.1 sigma-54-dependent Fis family transcriptional regulator [Nitrospirota bacterium]
MNILIAEDEDVSRKHLIYALEDEGYSTRGVTNGLLALEEIEKRQYHVLITDIKMPGMDGLELFAIIREKYPEISVIIITGYGNVQAAVEAIKGGAEDYITKPFDIDDLLVKLSKIKERHSLKSEIEALKASAGVSGKIPFIYKSAGMRLVMDMIDKLKDSDCNVTITGPTGSGKGQAAKLIHHLSVRAEKPFIGINCAVLTEELLASELFGHEKGAFTGAVATKKGLIELSHAGTLFLDEIAEMPTNLQARLLKAIEDGEFYRVGGTKLIKVDVRFIAATNHNIKTLITLGKFREDLYYRLNVMEVNIPPLKERKDDIKPLATFFLKKYAAKYKKHITSITAEATNTLMGYDFPGNVRELENIIERGVIIEATNAITQGSLPQGLSFFQIETLTPGKILTIEQLTKDYTQRVIEMFDGNKSLAADALGISRTSLWRLLKEESTDE